MPHAVSINEKSLDLIATNNGGIRPEIEPSPYANGCSANYFILPDDPNDHADIVSADHLFDNFEFVGPESDSEFRPIKPILEFVKREPYSIDRDHLAQMVAAHTSGLTGAVAEQDDYDTADDILLLLKKRSE